MNPNDLTAVISALDDRRIQATLARDAAALDAVLDDDMRYVHRSAVCEDKALYIERSCNGHYDYKAFDLIEREFRVFGDHTVLVNGDVRVQVVTAGVPRDFVSRFLQVWVRRDAGWKLASYHSINVPG
jgi:hypothetical protein